ncbi:MAG: DUF58 domain-containing protein, partial [Chloroflexi bacterium]|nr:DUF58 domain-containing protein [Chloroflexota bacterium]
LSELVSIFGIISFLLLLAIGWLVWQDVQRSPEPEDFHLTRQHHLKLGLMVDNPIDIVVMNKTAVSLTIELRDEVPDAFKQQRKDRILTGRVVGNGRLQLTYNIQPTRRGEYIFGSLNMRWDSAWGLFRRQSAYPLHTKARVYPNLLKIRQYDQLARQGKMLFPGLRQLRLASEGSQFEQLRDYLPDDDYRRISWKATARHGKPITIEYSPERSQNIIMLVETGRQMLTRPLGIARTTRLDLIINAVLLFSYVAISRGDRFGLMTFDKEIHRYLPPRSGMGQFYTVVESLYDVEARQVEPDYQKALHYLHAQRQNRSLILLLTDPTSPEAAQGLINQLGAFYPNHLPMCVTLSDSTVLDMARIPPYSMEAIYQRAVAEQVLDERQLWLDRLNKRGVMTLDVPAYELTSSVINKYLELKERARI